MKRTIEENQIHTLLNYDFLYDELPCGIISFSPEGKVYGLNKTLSNWVNKEVGEIIAQGFKSILNRASLLYYNLILEPLLNLNSEVNEINLQLSSQGGEIEILFNAVSYRNLEGKVLLVHATLHRITDRKRYETELLLERRLEEEQRQKLEFVFNLVPIQIWTADPAGKILSMNQKVFEYFGNIDMLDAGEFSGVYLTDRDKALSDWKKSVASGKRFEREMRLLGVRGTPEWFLVRADPVRNHLGGVEMWFCCSVDINKQKLLQLANQNELSQHLSKAYKSLDENAERFLSIALSQSHMVRKPVANIIALVELIKDKPDEQQTAQLLDMLYESVNELDQMIKELTRRLQ